MYSFYDYLIKSTREYRYRIRTVLTLNELHLDKIENVFLKYDLISIDGPKKTIMQARPTDFINMSAAEVFIVDVVTRIPVSPYILTQEIRCALNVPESFLVIRSSDDPNEIQAVNDVEEIEIAKIAANKKLMPAALLSTDPSYLEYQSISPDHIAGDEYTKKFLRYLAKVKAERPVIVIEPINKRRMFDYLKDQPLDPEYYKAADYVKPVAVKPGTSVEIPAPVSNFGNFDDTIKTLNRTYADRNGEKVLITAKKIK